MMPQFSIVIHNVTHTFNSPTGALSVLDDISVTFQQGTIYALTGVSGSGKSTLLHLIAGFDTPTAGSIEYSGAFMQYDIGFVFQNPFLMKELTILENVMLKGIIAGQSRESCKKEAFDLLKIVDLYDKRDCYPGSLSGGQQQRVALARAVFGSLAFLLADEPTAHLDSQNKQILLHFMQTIARERNVGLIISTHDKSVAHKADQVFTLERGKLIFSTTG